jgi:hypothetical protein
MGHFVTGFIAKLLHKMAGFYSLIETSAGIDSTNHKGV